MSLVTEKAGIRRRIREQWRGISIQERQNSSRQIIDRLRTQMRWRAAHTIVLYLPLPTEPDILPLFDAAFQEAKRVGLLRYDPASDQFHPRMIQNLERDLDVNVSFGSLEPLATCPLLPANQLDLVLVPGVAFTWSGCRLGRGRGYYDRFLSQASGIAIGVAYDWQIVENLPTESHDMGVDCVVTPTRWHEIQKDGRL